MRKQIFGRRLKKDTNQRKALFRNLMRSLILNEEIKTTEAKAKSIRSQIEKFITQSKKGDSAFYNLKKELNEDAVKKLINEVGPRFIKRNGGYTRIVKLDNRIKDNAEMAMIEFVEKGEKMTAKKTPKRKDLKKSTTATQTTKKTSTKKSSAKEAKSETKTTNKKEAEK